MGGCQHHSKPCFKKFRTFIDRILLVAPSSGQSKQNQACFTKSLCLIGQAKDKWTLDTLQPKQDENFTWVWSLRRCKGRWLKLWSICKPTWTQPCRETSRTASGRGSCAAGGRSSTEGRRRRQRGSRQSETVQEFFHAISIRWKISKIFQQLPVHQLHQEPWSLMSIVA